MHIINVRMISKLIEKEKVIRLRKEGKTYSEILSEVNVAKSSISLWLREVGLSKAQKQKLTEKRRLAGLRGGVARKKQRIKFCEEIFSESEKEIGEITPREFWLIGTMLYWGEGSKEKEAKPGSGVDFTNSDPNMIKLFLIWLEKVFGIKEDGFVVEIYIHKIYEHRINKVKLFWSKATGLPKSKFSRVLYKKHNPKTIRKNVGNMYNGNLRIRVKASSTQLRKITGWTRGIYKNKYCGIV